MEAGGTFLAQIRDQGIRAVPLSEVITRIQANVRRYFPEGTDMPATRRQN